MCDLIRRSDAVKAVASHFALKAEMRTGGERSWEDFKDAVGLILAKCETVDAEQVIHCRDCKYYVPDGDGDPHGGCTMTYSYMSEDGYCSDGERKTKIEVLKRDKDM